ncbi:hypothetical protein AUJ13_05685 [Candidatus Micrarchaeota archaeon CG1_02_49_24]|nr:MAG: hypothetical protein AUJ13_05685 [Candidatus Micrarchaeota archaeon CG1_02_49_24]HII53872.1 signal peptide peptidase SppA [Candidatus Micrarchaeota archaeon]
MDKRLNRILVLGLIGTAVLALIFFAGAIAYMLGQGQSAGLSMGKKCIAVIHLDGEIVSDDIQPGLFGEGQPGSETLAAMIRKEGGKEDVAAILLDINSPGGGSAATHDIYYALKNVTKPKVAYIKEIGASGGYYSAVATDYILSDPDALVGSIGARMEVEDYTGLMGKVGVNITEIKSGSHKDIGSPFKQMGPEEQQILQSIVDDSFQEFRDVVMAERGDRLNSQMLGQIFDARIMNGRQGLNAGLIDGLGTKQDAIDMAGKLAGLEPDEYEVCDVDESGSASFLNLKGIASLGPAVAAATRSSTTGVYFK